MKEPLPHSASEPFGPGLKKFFIIRGCLWQWEISLSQMPLKVISFFAESYK